MLCCHVQLPAYLPVMVLQQCLHQLLLGAYTQLHLAFGQLNMCQGRATQDRARGAASGAALTRAAAVGPVGGLSQAADEGRSLRHPVCYWGLAALT